MKNTFNKMFSRSLVKDIFSLLTTDINTGVDAKKSSYDEIYTNESSHIEIVGMKKRVDLYKWIMPTRIFEALVFKQKNRYNNRVFTVYN